MTTYKVYYRDERFGKMCLYVEVADTLGRKKVAEARRKAIEEHYIAEECIIKIVKDC